MPEGIGKGIAYGMLRKQPVSSVPGFFARVLIRHITFYELQNWLGNVQDCSAVPQHIQPGFYRDFLNTAEYHNASVSPRFRWPEKIT